MRLGDFSGTHGGWAGTVPLSAVGTVSPSGQRGFLAALRKGAGSSGDGYTQCGTGKHPGEVRGPGVQAHMVPSTHYSFGLKPASSEQPALLNPFMHNKRLS